MRMLWVCVITFCERGPATAVTPIYDLQSPSTQSWATSHDNHTGQTFVREVVIYLICMLVVVCWAMNRIRMLPHHLEDKVATKGHSCVVCLCRCVCGVMCVVCVCVCVYVCVCVCHSLPFTHYCQSVTHRIHTGYTCIHVAHRILCHSRQH